MYIFISDSQCPQYSSNTAQDFSVWLDQPLNLIHGKWECALTEYSIQCTPSLEKQFLINASFIAVSNVYGSLQPVLRRISIPSSNTGHHHTVLPVPYYIPVLDSVNQQLHFTLQPVKLPSPSHSAIKTFSCVLHFKLCQ